MQRSFHTKNELALSCLTPTPQYYHFVVFNEQRARARQRERERFLQRSPQSQRCLGEEGMEDGCGEEGNAQEDGGKQREGGALGPERGRCHWAEEQAQLQLHHLHQRQRQAQRAAHAGHGRTHHA
ncbi:hypothetical protein GOP47_0026183 [Adiantum capillus-veneris]|uniref:Uncharacterized protein n=1 Tax=Adiantum capillus-veneris TaxID=13818 RepID=A0A9D4U3S1_ADICA|nr:hypothetical protein GOP47_0026183 [Adiantum capillus-veneris]